VAPSPRAGCIGVYESPLSSGVVFVPWYSALFFLFAVITRQLTARFCHANCVVGLPRAR